MMKIGQCPDVLRAANSNEVPLPDDVEVILKKMAEDIAASPLPPELAAWLENITG